MAPFVRWKTIERPRKSLGQHFLKDARLAAELVRAGDLESGAGVLEIGPGRGIMTGILASMVAKRELAWLCAVEKDEKLADALQSRYADQQDVQVIKADFLAWDWREIPDRQPIQVVANLPYNVATPILFRLLDTVMRIPKICVMLQREVGERLQAKPGTRAYGRLSIKPQIYYMVHTVRDLEPKEFQPPPKVHSQFVVMERRATPLVDLSDLHFSTLFDQVVESIFQSRRKTLFNSLRSSPTLPVRPWREILAAAGVDPDRRGETLTPVEMANLAEKINKFK